MKKIISIILGIMLMFAMSVTSFAALVAEPTTVATSTEAAEPENVIVSVDFQGETFTPMNTSSTFLSAGKLHVKIENNLNKAISLSDISIDVAVKCPQYKNGEKVLKDGEVVYDTPAVSIDGVSRDSDYVINKKADEVSVFYDLIINYNADLLNKEAIFTISVNGVAKEDITVKTPWEKWIFVESAIVEDDTTEKEESESATQPSTPSEPEVTEKEETSTDTTAPTQPSTDIPEVTNPVTPETEEPSKAPADVDDTIPDTGATVPFAAIGTLVTSAITALVAKKKKEN